MTIALDLFRSPEVDHERLVITFDVRDPEVRAELLRRPEGEARDRYAAEALRIGVLALRQATGIIDADSIRREGDAILARVREALLEHGTQVSQAVASAFSRYLDPRDGLLPERLDRLVRPGGELDGVLAGVLERFVGADDSQLARTLASHVGEQSPLLRALSPEDKSSVIVSLRGAIEAALGQQRGEILREFSLDQPESALSRMVAQFSSEQPGSFGSRISKLLEDTRSSVERSLTLDDEGSALARLRRELHDAVERVAKDNQQFQQELRVTLEGLRAHRDAEARATTHGRTFEEAVLAQLMRDTQSAGDILEDLRDRPGARPRCKVGDFVLRLGAESAAPDARVAIEVKDDHKYDLRLALQEMQEARENREASLGLFVYARGSAPDGLQQLSRHGSDIVIVWDAEDPATDWVLKAGLSIVRALAVRSARNQTADAANIHEMELAIGEILRQSDELDKIKTWGDTVRSNGEKIVTLAGKVRERLERHVETLEENLRKLGGADGK